MNLIHSKQEGESPPTPKNPGRHWLAAGAVLTGNAHAGFTPPSPQANKIAPMKRLASLLLFVAAAATLTAAETPLFTLTKMADGVYAAITTQMYKINCNALIVVLDDSVLVVDTHSKPSAARAVMEQIKTISDKPVNLS